MLFWENEGGKARYKKKKIMPREVSSRDIYFFHKDTLKKYAKGTKNMQVLFCTHMSFLTDVQIDIQIKIFPQYLRKIQLLG